jgi:hypothetical protein
MLIIDGSNDRSIRVLADQLVASCIARTKSCQSDAPRFRIFLLSLSFLERIVFLFLFTVDQIKVYLRMNVVIVSTKR